jgi:hypothetical protein
MAIANLRPKLLEVETTLQHCADELVGHLCEAWPELDAAKSVDVALFVLERAIMCGGASVSTARAAYDASGLGSCDSCHRLFFE